MKKIKNAVLKGFLLWIIAVSMLFGMNISSVNAAEENDLSSGYHTAIMDFDTTWSEGASSSTLSVSGRTFWLNGQMQFVIYGYSAYDAIYMVKQEYNDEIENINCIGTEWTDNDGETLTGIDHYKELGYTDEKLNQYTEKLGEPLIVNEEKDVALFAVDDIDPDKKIGLIGYTKDDNMLWRIRSAGLKVNKSYVKDATNLFYVSWAMDPVDAGAESEPEWHAYVANGNYGAIVKSSSGFTDDNIKSVEISIDGEMGSVVAKLYISDALAESNPTVQSVVSRDFTDYGTSIHSADWLSLAKGTTWTEGNLYDSDEKCINLTLKADWGDDYGTYNVLTGMPIKITIGNSSVIKTVFLSEEEYTEASWQDAEVPELSYQNSTFYVSEDAELSVSVNTDSDAIEAIKKVAGDGDYKVYTLNMTANGETVYPRSGGTVKIEIPSDWDMTRFYAETWSGHEHTTSKSGSWLTVEEENGKNYLVFSVVHFGKDNLLNGGSISIAQVKVSQDVSSLEAGVYETEANFVKAGTDSETSMASGTLDSKVYLVVNEDGTKDVYMNFHGLVLNELDPDAKAYMGALWNKTDEDVTYFDYETDSEGALLENAGFDPITEFSCVKAVKIRLSDETYDSEKNQYLMKVIPPAMGAGQSYESVYGDPIDANLVFYSVTKVDDVQIPTYQKSVLRKAIDKAEGYDESVYSEDSWNALQAVLQEAKSYYESLEGTDAGTSEEISENIKNKSGSN